MNSQISHLVLTQNLSESLLPSNPDETNSLPVQIEKKLMYSTKLRMDHLWNNDHGPKLNAEKSFVELPIPTQE